jgi:hypothetical protein
MARSIAVYRRSDIKFVQNPPAVDDPSFEDWEHKALGCCLFDSPLGSESAVRQYWSDPAARLGLSLIASIYEQGFYVGCEWSAGKLDKLLDEITKLELHWKDAALQKEVLADLSERATSFRAAINTAKESNGIILLT